MRMISDEKICEVQSMVDDGFSHHFISKRTGVSRPLVSDIATGRRKEGLAKKKADYAHKNNLEQRDYDRIAREARELLVKNGRELRA